MVISSSRPGTIAAAPNLAFAVSFIVVVTAAAVAVASSSYASSLSAQRTPTSTAARFVAVAGSEAVGLRLCVLAFFCAVASPIALALAGDGGDATAAFASVVFCTVLGVFGVTPEAGFCADLGGLPRGRFSTTFGSLSARGDVRLGFTAGATAFSATFAARTADAGTKFSTHRLHPRLA